MEQSATMYTYLSLAFDLGKLEKAKKSKSLMVGAVRMVRRTPL